MYVKEVEIMYSIHDSDKNYLTKTEFCKICGISQSTCYKLMKNRKIKFEKCCDGLLHFCRIPIGEAYEYMQKRESKKEVSPEYKNKLEKFYSDKLNTYENVITSRDIIKITGYGKEAVRNWINSKKIPGIIVRNKFCVAKEDLLKFLTGRYYFNIIRKSKTHIEDFEKIGILKTGGNKNG